MDKALFVTTSGYFIELVRYALDKERQTSPAPEKPAEVSWQNLFALSERHYLSAVVYAALKNCENKPDESLLEKWEHAYHVCVHVDIHQQFAWEELKTSFAEKDLRILPLKGLNMKLLYPETPLRLMSDLDILYEKERFKEVEKELLALGYEFDKKTAASNHQVFSRPPVTLEMHNALFSEVSPYRAYYERVWDRALPTEEKCVYRLSPEDEYVFMLLHARKHFVGCGCGVRSVADFWLFLNRYGETLDREKVAREIAEADRTANGSGEGNDGLSLAEFEETVVREIGLWFESAEPVLDETGLRLVSDGVYGRQENVWGKNLRAEGKGKYLLRRLFPPLKTMRQNYPVLKKCPILLPFCWLHRGFRALFFRRDRVARELNYVKQAKPTDPKKEKNG